MFRKYLYVILIAAVNLIPVMKSTGNSLDLLSGLVPESAVQRVLTKFRSFYKQEPVNFREGNTGSLTPNIPRSNYRRISILNLSKLQPEDRLMKEINFTNILHRRIPFEDNKTKGQLELELLTRGFLVTCQWAFKLPNPLNIGEQCTLGELRHVLQSGLVLASGSNLVNPT